MTVLVIDVGGSSVKLFSKREGHPVEFDSTPDLGPSDLVTRVRAMTAGWTFEVISIGYPGTVVEGLARADPGNLGAGWVGYDFEAAFGRPVRLVNDAAMQAMGAYDGGRMLFLGLGTGIGSVLVSDKVVTPLELGCLWFRDRGTLFDRLGREGLERDGPTLWQRSVHEAVAMLRDAIGFDYLVLGGGNARLVDTLPPSTRRGANEHAFEGGLRLWEEVVEPHDQEPPRRVWRILN